MRRLVSCLSVVLGSLLTGDGPANATDLFASDQDGSVLADVPLPAVSAANGKFSTYGGFIDDGGDGGGTFGLEGSYTVPLGHSFGFQADGSVGAVDGEFVGTVGGHLFWRDPAQGLVGAYASYELNEAADSSRFRLAAEAHAYLDHVSLEGLIGWEHIDYDLGGHADELLALANVAVYPTDELRLHIGYHRFAGLGLAAAGLEYQLQSSFLGNGTSVYVEGRAGDNDHASIIGGVRFFFGQERKSLIRRHREDDPLFASASYVIIGRTPPPENQCPNGYDYNAELGLCIRFPG